MFSTYRLVARIFPGRMKKRIVKLLEYSNIDLEVNRFLGFELSFSILLSAVVGVYSLLLFSNNPWIVFGIFFAATQAFIFTWLALSAERKGRFVDSVLPDALQLMASNLRAGITIDKALFMAARPEFGPFKKELDKVGKEIAIGKNITKALNDLSARIKSDKLEKTIYLIVNGIRAGGSLAPLLERASQDLRDQELTDKKIRASIGMYRIFIFIAIGLAAPFLFSLSSVVVEILVETFSSVDVPKTASVAISLKEVTMPLEFIRNYSLIFISTSCVFGSLVLGLITKGKAKDGAKYIIPLLLLSITVFFVIRELLMSSLSGLFGM